jgi:hypothetical protein
VIRTNGGAPSDVNNPLVAEPSFNPSLTRTRSRARRDAVRRRLGTVTSLDVDPPTITLHVPPPSVE